MLAFGSYSRTLFPAAVLFLVMALAGCGNSCFAGFSNNGTGVVIIKVSNPGPTCSLNQANGMVRLSLSKSAVCQSCTTTDSPGHLFLTVKGIQLRSADPQSPLEWLEIAPQLAKEPRQVDLTASESDVLVEQAIIPAGSYRGVRLQFLSASAVPPPSLPVENSCRDQVGNCLIATDGHIEPLRQEDLVMELDGAPHIPFQLLPDGSVDLQLNLGVSPSALYFSESNGLRPQAVIVGQVVIVPQQPTRNSDSE